MHATQALALALPLLAHVVAGYTLPGNLTDGVYRVHVNKDGKEVHEPVPQGMVKMVKARSPPAVTTPEELAKRDIKIECGCGWAVDHGNCDAAVANLANQVSGDPIIYADTSYYAIAGNVVAFVCNNGWDGAIAMNDDALSLATSTITNACGWYIAGTYTYDVLSWIGVEDAMDIGYMQYYGGEDFCGNAASSQVSSC